MTIQQTPVGQPLPRLDGPLKVTGTATYAYEYPATNPAYLLPLQASIPRGRITNLDTSAAEALDGVIAILSTRTAPELVDTDDREMAILIDDEVHFRGQLIGGVIAQTAEIAREAAGLVRVEYAEEPFQTELDPDSDDLYQPESLIDQQPSDSDDGDLDAALSDAEVLIDQTYTTPMEHNNPMEPHATVALWHENPTTGSS